MKIDIKTIENLANLARIDLPEVEKEILANDLAGVLAYVDQVQGVAKGLLTTESAQTLKNIAANDEALHIGGEYTENILNEAPGREGEYLVVKKVL